MALKTIICDDNKKARYIIKCYLDKINLSSIEVIGEAGDGAELIETCKNEKPDIVILDIDMPGINGLDAAKEITKFLPEVSFIFITAYTSFAVDAFEVYPVDYIIKPVSIERLEKSLKRIIDYSNKSDKMITFKFNNENYTIEQSSILFIEKVGRKTVIHTLARKIEVNEPLSSIIERLDLY